MGRFARPPSLAETHGEWQKNKRLLRDGFRDLQYVPAGRSAWNMTLAALAYAARRRIADRADLNLWAAMHGCPPSGRYAYLGDDALVLWHGTSAERADKIAEVGIFNKEGAWATFDPKIAHGYTRVRGRQYAAGSAMGAIVVDRGEVSQGRDYADHGHILEFRRRIPARWIEYVLSDDRIEFVGEEKTDGPSPWAVARFKRRSGHWIPRTQPPVRFDDDSWLHMSVARAISALGACAAIEILSSAFATVRSWDPLSHAMVLETAQALTGEPRRSRGFTLFAPAVPTTPDQTTIAKGVDDGPGRRRAKR